MSKNKKQVSFDDYVDSYEKEIQSSIGFIGQDHNFFIKVKANRIIEIAGKNFSDLGELKILDIGCGIGLIDKLLAPYFQNLYGVDVEDGVVSHAKAYNPGVRYELYNGSILPFEGGVMDIVFAINVMHHVPPEKWMSFVDEMYRILKPGGMAIVFEHNPLNPLTRLAVDKCEFDRDAVLLHKNKLKKLYISCGFRAINSNYILFFPFRHAIFRSIEKIFEWLPLGAQFYITGKKGT